MNFYETPTRTGITCHQVMADPIPQLIKQDNNNGIKSFAPVDVFLKSGSPEEPV